MTNFKKIKKFSDKRGFFFEFYNHKNPSDKMSIKQINFSISKKNVIRGLHYQQKKPQQKKLTVLKGKIFDVLLDLRKNSKNFGKIKTYILDDNKQKHLTIPKGFAHGFMSLEENSIICYIVDEYYNPKNEKTILWNDPALKIKWPKLNKVIVSPKDKKGITFNPKKKYF